VPVSRAFRADSSRTSRDAAGWANAGKCDGDYVRKAKRATYPRRFSWLRPRVLLESRNHVLADLVRKANTDIVNDERMRWVAAQRAAGIDTEFLVDHSALGERYSFLAVGDPGEGDVSQYVVAPHLLSQADTSFMVIVSDVIYPAGETNDYADAFYRPFREYPHPIYGIPGNHDWYSLLTGFMWNICGAEPPQPPVERLASYTWQERLARFLWLRPKQTERELLMAYREERWRAGRSDDEQPRPHQDGPYFAIETEPLLIVCIDTGTSGILDREQGHWLLRIARRPGPKLLLTGRPLWVNGEPKPCDIKWLPFFSSDKRPELTGDPAPVRTLDEPEPPDFPTVDSIIQRPEHGFIAAIGGDIHNYQRYPMRVGEGPDTRLLQYITSGGGGAFMSPTHTVDDVGGFTPVGESEYRCYPLRGDSLARFARGSTKRLRVAVFGAFVAALALWFLALQVWNPKDAGILQWLNLNPQSDVGGVSPLSWLPEDIDYDRWAAVVLGGLALAVGIGLLALPWFHWRIKAVLALVAVGAALLAWNGALLDLPAGEHSYLAGIVGAVAIPVLALERAREIKLRYRVVVALGLFVVAAIFADWKPVDSVMWDIVRELTVLGGIALLLVGGPRLNRKSSLVGSAAVLALTALVFALYKGWSWIVIALLALGLTLFALYALVLLGAVLVAGGDIDPDQAAESMASEGQHPVRRPEGAETPGLVGRWKLAGLRPGKRSRFLYPGETIYSALFDYNDQPFFKSFLRIDVAHDDVKIYCFGVAEEGADATVEDHLRWAGGRWTDARAILGRIDDGAVVGEVDWYDDPSLVLHLEDSEAGNRFAVLVSADGKQWRGVGTVEYRPGEPWQPEHRIARPRWIGLRPEGEDGEKPTFAVGHMI
jgi:hypothetical protein